MPTEPIRLSTKALRPHKAVNGAQFAFRSVLTSDPFNYVDLWLRRQHLNDALFYWRQSRAFYQAAQNLPMESAPLVLYYCFMNAAKALLSAKRVPFNEHHGVKSHLMRGPNSKIMLSNEGIKIKNSGIVPALSGYLNESETSLTHSLEDLLYNLVFIHRTYCLSYPRRTEIFLPLKGGEYVRDTASGEVWFQALAVEDIDWKSFKKRLPAGFVARTDGAVGIRSAGSIVWTSTSKPSSAELVALAGLNQLLRTHLHYINGAQTLWYLKTDGHYRIARQPITLTLSAMHRLSEICRYRPSELDSFLNGQKNWLLSEFVAMAPSQFLDEIACEMTGHQVMIPNVRAPI